MFRAYSFLFIFCAVLTFAFSAQKITHAQVIEEAIVIPPPEPSGIVVTSTVTSAGLFSCYKINDGFFRGKWVTPHRICQYERDKKMAWVEEHWTCYKYDSAGVCMTWVKWSSGWYKTIYIAKPRATHRPLYSPIYPSYCEPDIPLDPCKY